MAGGPGTQPGGVAGNPRAWETVTWLPTMAAQHSTGPRCSGGLWPVGSGHQGVAGPLLQPEGQSCYPRTAWLPPEGLLVLVTTVQD